MGLEQYSEHQPDIETKITVLENVDRAKWTRIRISIFEHTGIYFDSDMGSQRNSVGFQLNWCWSEFTETLVICNVRAVYFFNNEIEQWIAAA